MLSRYDDPIAAITTAPGRGAVGIIRVSAASVAPVIHALCARSLKAREATYLSFVARDGRVIDQGLAIHFPAPHSYTGDDVLELQAHGGAVVLQLLLARVIEAGLADNPATGLPWLAGMRVALPGEFTQRAFLNGKMDLAQAEGVADLIDASTEAAARSASRSLSGEFSREVHSLRDALVHLRMLVEATLDFPEEDIDFLQQSDAQGQLDRLGQGLARLMNRAQQGALLREGIRVVIAGPPNVGKSSLLNALAGAELAIVTPIAGTTRDKVQQTIQMEGVPVHVIDTAGLRDSTDEVEAIGIARAWDEIAQADALIFLRDLSRADTPNYIAEDAIVTRTLANKLPVSVPIVEVWNKTDVSTAVLPARQLSRDPSALPGSNASAGEPILLSAKTGDGLDALRARLLKIAGWQTGIEGVFIARERHIQALTRVKAHLGQSSLLLTGRNPALDLLAEELRLAQNSLNEITGEFNADDLLGVIFSSFCIGK